MAKEDVKNLIKRKVEGTTSFICSIDGTVLVDIDNHGSFRSMTSCPHFQWNELTKASYYLGVGDVPLEELQHLRKNAILVLHQGMFVNVLVPTKVNEEE